MQMCCRFSMGREVSWEVETDLHFPDQFRHGLSYFPPTARKSVRGEEIGFQPPWYEAGALITNLSQKCKFCRVTPADLVCSTQLERELSLR